MCRKNCMWIRVINCGKFLINHLTFPNPYRFHRRWNSHSYTIQNKNEWMWVRKQRKKNQQNIGNVKKRNIKSYTVVNNIREKKKKEEKCNELNETFESRKTAKDFFFFLFEDITNTSLRWFLLSALFALWWQNDCGGLRGLLWCTAQWYNRFYLFFYIFFFVYFDMIEYDVLRRQVLSHVFIFAMLEYIYLQLMWKIICRWFSKILSFNKNGMDTM